MAREGIKSTKQNEETGDTQIKTKMYHPLLNDLYNIPPPCKINNPNSTNTQTHLEEKEIQSAKSHMIQRDTEPTAFVLSPLPYPNNPLTTNPVPTPLKPNGNQTNTHQHVVTPNKEARINHHHQPPTNHTASLYDPLRTLNINTKDFKALHPTLKTQLIQ